MNIIPAIDISDGKVIRLKRGKIENKTIYSDNPHKILEDFIKSGAEWVHIVDIDRATCRADNRDLIKELLNIKGIKKEVGGGLRTKDEIIQMFEYGANRAVIGTAACRNKDMVKSIALQYPGKIIVALDFSNNSVMIDGWSRDSGSSPIEFAKQFMPEISLFLLTDISKDGMLSGIDEKFYSRFAVKTGAKTIVSGGVQSIEDIKKAMKLSKSVEGIIIGKALYEKKFSLKEALEVSNGKI